MKTTILKTAFIVALSVGIFSSCVKDDDYSTPKLTDCGGTTLVANREVSQITANATVSQHVNIVDGVSDVIEAYVTSSDMGGNFFKSISFQTLDGSSAFSVPVDATNTFISYEPGRKVLIKMDGLYTANPTSGTLGMTIGSLYVSPTSGTPSVGRMAINDFKSSVQPSCTVVSEDELLPAVPVTIGQLTSSGNTYLNRLVELNNVMFDDASIQSPAYYNSANDIGGATNLHILDINGGSVIFRTSSYSNFAAKSVLKGSGKIRGILTKYGTDYQFLARQQSDIKLSDDIATRFTPLLNESFSSLASFSNWRAVSVSGAQVWTYSSTFGNPGGMAKMSGFTTTNNANEDWLISPKQDLSTLTAATLSFDNAYKFAGDPIVVLISNNYPGNGSPYAAGVTWTTLTGATLSAGNYVYANSGNLNISTFTGTGNNNVYVAFKYTCSNSAASTWEIDNVKVTAN